MVYIDYSVNCGLRILVINHISPIKKSVSIQIKMNMLFKTKDVIKRKRRDRKLHKTMIIPVDTHERNKMFTVTVQPKMHLNWNL